jgi:hypothetical protein
MKPEKNCYVDIRKCRLDVFPLADELQAKP